MAYKILVVDDAMFMRTMIKNLLKSKAEFEVIGEASGGTEAVKITSNLKPDILVTDLKMPELDGIEVIRDVRESSPGTRVIVISMYGVKLYVDAALRAGALGYVHKKSSVDGLIEAIRAVAAGKNYVSPSIK